MLMMILKNRIEEQVHLEVQDKPMICSINNDDSFYYSPCYLLHHMFQKNSL